LVSKQPTDGGRHYCGRVQKSRKYVWCAIHEVVGDGDSSAYARILAEVPVWGCEVQKAECANHATKCLRTNLERLVDDNPSYKGKGLLSKAVRIRLVNSVRSAICMRSKEPNKAAAAVKLRHGICNSIAHIFDDHSHCASDFCRVKVKENSSLHVSVADATTGDSTSAPSDSTCRDSSVSVMMNTCGAVQLV
jgi:hypothetical protein